MRQTLRIAKAVSREVAYRGFKGAQYSAFTPYARRRNGKVDISVLKVNIFGSLFYAFLSFSISTVMLYPPGNVSVETLYKTILTILAGLAMLLGLLQIIPFTSTFIREKIIDLLRVLPLNNKQIITVYIAAYLLYWGGLSLYFLFIPFFAVSAISLIQGLLGLADYLAGILSVASLFLFSYMLGIGLGTYSYMVRRSLLMRTFSTIGWVVGLLVILLMYKLFSITTKTLAGLKDFLHVWGPYIPFIGFLYSLDNPLYLLISSSVSGALLILVYLLVRDRVAKVFILGIETVASAKPYTRKTDLRGRTLRVKGLLRGMVFKDLKLLLREPRRLAVALFAVVFPVFMVFPATTSMIGHYAGYTVSFLASFIGVFAGLGCDQAYYAEGSGARVLYSLPVKRRLIALSKAFTVLTISIPVSAAIILGYSAFIGLDPLSALFSVFIMTMLETGYSLLYSVITLSMLPREPSEWNEYSISSRMGKRLLRNVLRIAVVIVGVVVPSALLIVSTMLYLSYMAVVLFLLVYSGLILLIGCFTACFLVGDDPL